jgi:hypothetical protein
VVLVVLDEWLEELWVVLEVPVEWEEEDWLPWWLLEEWRDDCWLLLVFADPPPEDCWLPLLIPELLLEDCWLICLLLDPAVPLWALWSLSSSSCLSCFGAVAPNSSEASLIGAAAPPLAFIPGRAIGYQSGGLLEHRREVITFTSLELRHWCDMLSVLKGSLEECQCAVACIK